MDISYGIDQNVKLKEIDKLIQYGITEFFLGIIPPEWRKKYGYEVSTNKRVSKADNFTDYRKLKEVTGYIKSKNKKVHIALNDFMYTKQQLGDIRNIVYKLEKYSPHAYIIGDVSLILQFEKWGIKKPIHVGITSGCLNQYSVNFFKQFSNVKRVHLPRYLSLKEIEEIRINSDLELGCFGVTGACEFGEEYCFTYHSDGKEIFCNRQFIIPKEKKENIPKQRNFIDRLKCGLCAVAYFDKIGINCIKFPGRGHKMEIFKILGLIKKACACNNQKEIMTLQKDKTKCTNYNNCAYYTAEVKI